ncbi:WXG100 family type VII secretion target [Amycolatopsis sp.]|jgi:WXG100 family type VII secretion target|uniref:WXG100 family type VII secretion target n=1 Tax=Amycolatopsis sp. TaxID=37632 RepID=UPI002DFF87E5|nr:WXG100 family type VII secretion target [Amycolatopsis sp.]
MSMQDQLHGELASLDRAASMAGTVSTDIEGHRSALRPAVEALRGQWEGAAFKAFLPAHEQWEAGITRLVAALGNLGDNTRFSSNAYAMADENSASALTAVQGHSPFGGALQG